MTRLKLPPSISADSGPPRGSGARACKIERESNEAAYITRLCRLEISKPSLYCRLSIHFPPSPPPPGYHPGRSPYSYAYRKIRRQYIRQKTFAFIFRNRLRHFVENPDYVFYARTFFHPSPRPPCSQIHVFYLITRPPAAARRGKKGDFHRSRSPSSPLE